MIGFYAAGAMGSGGGGDLDPNAVSVWPKIVAWYEHSETSGSTMVDSHGSLNGFYTGGITLGAAPIATGLGACINVTASSAYTEVNYDSALDLPATHAFMCWFRRTTDSQPTFAKILWKPTDVFLGKGTYYLGYEPSGNTLRYRFNSGGDYYDATTSPIANNTTYMAIGNKLETGSDLYLNGSLGGSQASGGTPDTQNTALRQGSSGSGDGMIGYLGPTALFNAPLTTDEIAYLYAGGAGVKYATLKAQSGH